MLRITVELVPHGDETRARTLATMNIANVGGEEYSDYVIAAQEQFDSQQRNACLKQYPRWGASLWDMVGRAASLVAHGTEAPKHRPTSPQMVTVGEEPNAGTDFSEVAKRANPTLEKALQSALAHSTCPLNGYYWHDVRAFLRGSRSPSVMQNCPTPSFSDPKIRGVLARSKKRKTSFRTE